MSRFEVGTVSGFMHPHGQRSGGADRRLIPLSSQVHDMFYGARCVATYRAEDFGKQNTSNAIKNAKAIAAAEEHCARLNAEWEAECQAAA